MRLTSEAGWNLVGILARLHGKGPESGAGKTRGSRARVASGRRGDGRASPQCLEAPRAGGAQAGGAPERAWNWAIARRRRAERGRFRNASGRCQEAGRLLYLRDSLFLFKSDF